MSSETLPGCPICGGKARTPDRDGDTCCNNPGCSLCPDQQSFFTPAEWLRLAAPPLPPTVVAVLEAVENLDQADDFRPLNPDLLEIEQERLLAAWHAYVAAGRPGMEP